MLRQLSPNLFRFTDTCQVYVLRSGTAAILIDFGTGAVLDHLDEIGVEQVTDVLVTHHHRDQVQGLDRAVSAGIAVWVPPTEVDLFARVDEHWRMRAVANDYNLRQDRFSLLWPVEPAGTVAEYQSRSHGAFDVYTLPTPGHTVGSVSYLVEVDGRQVAFSGDLIYGPGQVWSLAATQWTYSGYEGLCYSVVSCRELTEAEPEVLLPSHGDPVDEPSKALDQLADRLLEVITMRRGSYWDLDARRNHPWEAVTPHVLRNTASHGTTYAVLSDDRSALFIDFGYDLEMGLPAGSDRAARRPLLSSMRALRRDYGVDRIEVVIPTHFHDDHVAGFNLIREVQGTEVWAAANIAPVLAEPLRYDLPCLWYDPIPTDRVLPLETPVRWRDYEFTCYELPGHTYYAVAIAFEADGHRILVTGDQQDGAWVPNERRELLNYQYRNGFDVDDFARSAALYRRLRPDVILTGHWRPRWVDDAYLAMLAEDGDRMAALHRELLPMDRFDFGRWGFGARIAPYRSTLRAGGGAELTVSVRNPLPDAATVRVDLVVPPDWHLGDGTREVRLAGHEETELTFHLTAPQTPQIRARIGADVTVGSHRLGIVAEALLDVATSQ